MKVSYNWLKDYITSEVDLKELVEILTNTGLEVGGVEKVEQYKGGLQGLVIGEIKKVEKHPNADRLSLTKVDVGNGEEKSIVCGAPNVAKGQKVVVATVGTTLFPTEGEPFKIKKGKIRGEVSEGMICAEDEIGMGTSHDGILVLKKSAPVGSLLRDYLKISEDYAIEIDLTPNRTDAISHFGVARDYLAVKNLQPGFKREKINIPSVASFEVDNHDLEIAVDVLNKGACPRYSGISMTEVEVKESPDWLKNKLKSVGLNPINNIVDAANFVMYETGQPMHVFDAAEINGNKVIVRPESQGYKFKTLDEEERELDSADLMICNATDPMCIAGVFGGLTSGVKESTTSIFIESAYFSPSGIRKTARRHGLNTDASYRYERGANPDATIYALKRLALLLKDLAGGKVSSDIVDVYPFKIEQNEVSLRWSYLNTIAGKDLLKDEVRGILSSLDIDIMMEEKESIKLRIPGYRTDVTREIDVVEEILRIYGYNNIDLPERMRTSFSNRPPVDADKIQLVISNMMASLGFREIMNNSLNAAKNYENEDELVGITNPLSNELSVLRSSLFEGGMQSIAYNINRKEEDLKFFEFGKVYRLDKQTKYHEEMRMAVWMTGNVSQESWKTTQRKVDFFDLKQVCENVFSRLGIDTSTLTAAEADGGMLLKSGEDILAWYGEVPEARLKAFDVKQGVLAAEIFWDKVLDLRKAHKTKFQALPKFPSMRRDLALLISEEVSYESIENIARGIEKNLLRDVNLFDVYKGKGVEKGKKSYAVSFTFMDEKKTLTDKQVDKIMDKLVGSLKKELGADLR